MVIYRKMRLANKIIIPVGIVLALMLGILAYVVQSKSSEALQRTAERELIALSGRYGNEVRALFEVALDKSSTLADALSHAMAQKKNLPRETLIDFMTGIEMADSTVLGVGAIFEPNAFDGNDAAFINTRGSDAQGRFVPYSSSGKIEAQTGVESFNYYTEPKKRNKAFITNPFLYEVNGVKQLLTTVATPVRVNGQFKGAVLVDISLDTLSELTNHLDIYTTGWGALLTQDGTIITSLDPAMVNQNIFTQKLANDLEGLRNAMQAGKPFMEIFDSGNGTNIEYYFPIYFAATGQTFYFIISAPLAEVLADVATIQMWTIGLSLAVLAAILLLIFVIIKINIKPLGVLVDASQKIAGGNLHVPIEDETFGGEILELSSSLKAMLASLLSNIAKAEEMSKNAQAQTAKAEMAMQEAEQARLAAERAKSDGMHAAAEQLAGSVNIISSASEELSSQMEHSEMGAGEQAGRITETATAMEEMNSTVLEVSRSASMASEISTNTKHKAEEGTRMVHDVVESIRNVQHQSLTLKEDMSVLSGHAQAINQIMGVISDIADQTNLLALNAAIEAARAGDAGRGFAVVADEVRKLAEKTMNSTSDVGNAIRSIQDSAHKSITQVDATVLTIEAATSLADKSGEVLVEILALADKTADQVRSIATASEQQSATSEEINRSISHVNSIATDTSRAMQEAASAVSELASQAHTLQELVEAMKKS